ncbi:MAG TPA: DUF6036 family nucleotidyltransferase [Candidatus Limnocylindrales bacterium]|nr:DUF6036 family nucleotidyltransferase [Candidatus Limnocylindrales bacterium]
MNSQERAIADLARLLSAAAIPYMLIGGHANAIWGEPRATLDVDVTIWATEHQAEHVAAILEPAFQCLVEQPVNFVRDVRVLPFRSLDGVRIDVIFGLLPFEKIAIGRARRVSIAGCDVQVCSPEDLILMKVISERPRDLEDARGVVLARYEDLDFDYLDPQISELAEFLAKPEMARHWSQWKHEAKDRRRA